jgi:hypothetical protein
MNMMQSFLTAQAVSFTIELRDESGLAIDAASIQYRLIDDAEADVIPKTAIASFTPGDPAVTIETTAEHNTLAPGSPRGIRVIELYVTRVDGVSIKLSREYLIEAEEILTEGLNSFQNYPTALLGSVDIPNLDAWVAATKADRIVAMTTAWRAVGQLRFRYVFDGYQNIIDNTMAVSDITLASLAEYRAFPVQFKQALRRAQIIEANYLLGGDELDAIRESGVTSMVVGESTNFYRATKPLTRPICKAAMKELSKWVVNRQRVTRA